MTQPGAAKIIGRLLIDPFVLAEDEAACQRRLSGRHSFAKSCLGPLADLTTVEERQSDRYRSQEKR